MYYIIYKITNIIDKKIYIGKHQTNNIDDKYIGSGKYLKRAINKYSIDKFKKEILHTFNNVNEMNEMEAKIVNEDFVKRKDTYNLKLGGEGGFDHLNDGSKDHIKRTKKGRKIANENGALKKAIIAIKKKWEDEEFRKFHTERLSQLGKKLIGDKNPFYGKHHKQETKDYIGKITSISQSGEGNSQYGTCWIYNLLVKENKKIPKDNLQKWLNEGWIKGRKMKF